MHPIRVSPLSREQLQALDQLYRTTHDVRVRTRARIVLLADEQGLVAAAIARLVRTQYQPAMPNSWSWSPWASRRTTL